MTTRLCPMRVGVDTVYAVQGEGFVLVDGGQPGCAALLPRRLAAARVPAHEVRLIVVTHGHWDHIGCVAALRGLSGAPVAMHEAERDRLELGRKVMPPGVTAWGKVLVGPIRAMMRRARLEPAPVDLPVADEGLSLAPYGVAGRVVHTPGHSPGSLSVVLASGDALVGDLAMSMLPLRLRPGLPIFAEEPARLRGSIEALLSAGARTIHPAHGPPFPASVLERALRQL